jgi:hypothetical protein
LEALEHISSRLKPASSLADLLRQVADGEVDEVAYLLQEGESPG